MAAIRMNNGVPILNGTTLAFDDDENCCCSAAPLPLGCASNPCTGDTCGGSNNPNIIMKIFDVDYLDGSGDIQWAGQTWTPQQIRDGDCKCACPASYQAPNILNYVSASYYAFSHRWANYTGVDLRMRRSAYVQGFPPADSWVNSVHLNFLTARNYRIWSGSNLITPNLIANVPASFTAIDAVARPILSDYAITNDFFDWTITLSGVQYSIAKGINWP